MATIIRKGTKEKIEKTMVFEVYETKCDRCGCVFEAEEKEFRSECGLSIINCPQCGRLLDNYRWEYSKKKTKTKTIKVWE